MKKGSSSIIILVLLGLIALGYSGKLFATVQPPDELIYDKTNLPRTCPEEGANIYCDPDLYTSCKRIADTKVDVFGAGEIIPERFSSYGWDVCQVWGTPLPIEEPEGPSVSIRQIPSYSTGDDIIIYVDTANIPSGEFVGGSIGALEASQSVSNNFAVFNFGKMNSGSYTFNTWYGSDASDSADFTVLALFQNFRIDALPSQRMTDTIYASIHIEDESANCLTSGKVTFSASAKWSDGSTAGYPSLSYKQCGDWDLSFAVTDSGTATVYVTATKQGYETQTAAKSITISSTGVDIDLSNIPSTAESGETIDVKIKLRDPSTGSVLLADKYFLLTVTHPDGITKEYFYSDDFIIIEGAYVLKDRYTFSTYTSQIESYTFQVTAEASGYDRNTESKTVNVSPGGDCRLLGEQCGGVLGACCSGLSCDSGVCSQKPWWEKYWMYILAGGGVLAVIVVVGGKFR